VPAAWKVSPAKLGHYFIGALAEFQDPVALLEWIGGGHFRQHQPASLLAHLKHLAFAGSSAGAEAREW